MVVELLLLLLLFVVFVVVDVELVGGAVDTEADVEDATTIDVFVVVAATCGVTD